jgi:uncharacterized protein
MVVDVHSHAWLYPVHFTCYFHRQTQQARVGIEVDLSVTFEAYCDVYSLVLCHG